MFYDDIYTVLGARAAMEPAVLLQSGAAETEVTVGIEESLAAEVAENLFQSTESLNYTSEGSVSHINCVWPVSLTLQLI